MKIPKRALTRVAALSLALASSLIASQAMAQSSAQVRSWAASCSNCHGTNGKAQPGMIPLAGYNAEMLVKAMAEFKSGARPAATVMHQLAKGYSDEQIKAIAAYYAAQK